MGLYDTKPFKKIDLRLKQQDKLEPDICQVCKKKFINNSKSWFYHKSAKKHFGENEYCCKMCKVMYNNLKDLKTHYENDHKNDKLVLVIIKNELIEWTR